MVPKQVSQSVPSTIFGLVLCFISQVCISADDSSSDWAQFRGPIGTGRSSATNLPLVWGSFLEPCAWQASIPGRGWSSPIAIGNRIWVTTAETIALRETEVVKTLAESPTGISDSQAHGSVTLFAIELDLQSGKILRKFELFSADNPPPIHSSNSYASPTPISDGVRLYCHFGSLGTVAVELETGVILWKKVFAIDDLTGSGSSPVLCDDRLILTCDGADEQYVVAIDKRTGEEIWKVARPPIDAKENFLRRAFSTPLLIEYEGRKQLLAPAAQWLVSYNPETGEEWWRCKTAVGYSVVPQPVFHEGLVFACSGYMKPELWAIRADGNGDVSQTHVAWKCTRQAPEIASPIVVDDAIYFVSTMGILSCLHANDGNQRWQHRLDGSYASSLVSADNKIYVTNKTGLTTVFKPGSVYTEIAKNQLFGETMATIAIAGESLLLRTDPILYCIRKDK